MSAPKQCMECRERIPQGGDDTAPDWCGLTDKPVDPACKWPMTKVVRHPNDIRSGSHE